MSRRGGVPAHITEARKYAPVLQYYDAHVRQDGEPHTPYLLRELYGEHAASPKPPNLPQRNAQVLDVVEALSRGVKIDDLAAELDWYGRGTQYYTFISQRTAMRRTQEALRAYTTHAPSAKRLRPVAVKAAIEVGDIDIAQGPPDQKVLGTLPLSLLTVLHLTEQGYAEEEIAGISGYTASTVAAYSSEVMRRLETRNADTAVRTIREAGIFRISYAPRVPRAIMEEAGIIFGRAPAEAI